MAGDKDRGSVEVFGNMLQGCVDLCPGLAIDNEARMAAFQELSPERQDDLVRKISSLSVGARIALEQGVKGESPELGSMASDFLAEQIDVQLGLYLGVLREIGSNSIPAHPADL